MIRAPRGGCEVIEGHYKGGEFLPFYVPRPLMPQVDEADYPRFIADAVHDARKLVIEAVPVSSLHAHQRIDHFRAKLMPAAVKMKPVIVSADNFIVDGNHRWWAHVYQRDPLILTVRLDLPFDEAIEWALARPYVYRISNHPEEN